MWKVTFTCKGYIVDVIYNEARTESEAIEHAKMHVVSKFDAVRAEHV